MSHVFEPAITESLAIEKLIAHRVLATDIGQIMQSVARTTSSDIPELGGFNIRVVTLVIDNSASMAPHKNLVIDGQRVIINSLLQAPLNKEIYLSQLLFNHEIEYLQTVVPLRDPVDRYCFYPMTRLLDQSNYVPQGATGLYDAVLKGITMLTPIWNLAEELGLQIFTSIVVITDGKDECDRPRYQNPPRYSTTKPDELKRVIKFLREQGMISDVTLLAIGEAGCRSTADAMDVKVEQVSCAKDFRKLFEPQAIRD